MRASAALCPVSVAWYSKGLEHCGGHVLRLLGIVLWLASVGIRRADDTTTLDSASGEPDRLNRPPVIAARRLSLADAEDLRRPAELSGHDQEGLLQEASLSEIIEECRDRAIHRREEVFLEVRKGVYVGIPGLVVSQVDLDQVDPGLDQLSGGQQGPAEGVVSVALEGR